VIATVSEQEKAIRAAIELCLEDCYRSSSPVSRIAEFVGNLRLQEWDDAVIRRVELTVLKMLSAMMSEDNENRSPPIE